MSLLSWSRDQLIHDEFEFDQTKKIDRTARLSAEILTVKKKKKKNGFNNVRKRTMRPLKMYDNWIIIIHID